MAKHVEYKKRLVLAPFNYQVKVVLTNNVQASAKKRGVDIDCNWYAMHAHNDNLISLIILPLTCGVRTVAHEVSHCTYCVMTSVGAEFENEIMAYLNGYLTGEICEFLRKHSKTHRHFFASKPPNTVGVRRVRKV